MILARNLSVIPDCGVILSAVVAHTSHQVSQMSPCVAPLQYNGIMPHNEDEAEDWGLERWVDVAAIASS